MPKKKSRKSPRKKKHNDLINKFIGLVLLIMALSILIVPSYISKHDINSKNPISISKSLMSSKTSENTPLRVIIPKVNIDLPVVPAKVIDGYWELSDSTASYGLGSGYPGTNSNSVIFAHAREGLFYNLKDIKTGDIIYVFSKNKWFRYKVNKITAVYPNDTTVIEPTKKETLTLYTCTGFYDEKRLIVSAIPQK